MTGWLQLNSEQRKATIDQASILSGKAPEAIEKDWWVTLSLRALFSTPLANYFLFKGGTSLSKGWKLLPRFSEDIDIALDPASFEMEYKEEPSGSYVKKLKKEGCKLTSSVILQQLKDAFSALGLPNDLLVIEAEAILTERPDKDPQSIFIHYPSLYAPHPYLANTVKIEFSVRSLKIPFSDIQIESLLHEYFPNKSYAEIPFTIPAAEPRKTFLEKTLLLHEKFFDPVLPPKSDDRMSRHLYDLVTMMDSGVLTDALASKTLFTTLVRHRQYYVRLANYEQLTHETISFVPTSPFIEAYRQDYQLLSASMLGETYPTFDELLSKLKWINGLFHTVNEATQLEDLVQESKTMLGEEWKDKPANTKFFPQIHKTTDPTLPSGPANKSVIYEITLLKYKDTLQFEGIKIYNEP
jgi:hypothetical protein